MVGSESKMMKYDDQKPGIPVPWVVNTSGSNMNLQVGPGHHVFVSGAGPIGLMTAMCAKAAGAATVTITVGETQRCQGIPRVWDHHHLKLIRCWWVAIDRAPTWLSSWLVK